MEPVAGTRTVKLGMYIDGGYFHRINEEVGYRYYGTLALGPFGAHCREIVRREMRIDQGRLQTVTQVIVAGHLPGSYANACRRYGYDVMQTGHKASGIELAADTTLVQVMPVHAERRTVDVAVLVSGDGDIYPGPSHMANLDIPTHLLAWSLEGSDDDGIGLSPILRSRCAGAHSIKNLLDEETSRNRRTPLIYRGGYLL